MWPGGRDLVLVSSRRGRPWHQVRGPPPFSWPDTPALAANVQIIGPGSFRIALARMCTAFAVLALMIASVGLYGTMNHNTARRVDEIGIRMALGAGRGEVLRLILREAAVMGVVGIGIGIPAALAASRVVEGFLGGGGRAQ